MKRNIFNIIMSLFLVFCIGTSQAELEITCAIIKPDAVEAKKTGAIISTIEEKGFGIVRLEKLTLSREAVEIFYAEHAEKSFFPDLVEYMTSGPVVVMALSRENAVKAWRNLMGATDPAAAKKGTIRKLYGSDITHNAVHGSDSQERAWWELVFFFLPQETMEDEFDQELVID